VVLSAGLLPHLVRLMSREDSPKLQFEATWCVTNIASGTSEHTNAVIAAGATDILLGMLRSREAHVREQAVWAVGNIVGDSPANRDMMVIKHAVDLVIALIDPKLSPPISIIRNVTWCLSNFCRGKPRSSLSTVRPCVKVLSYLVSHVDDVEVLTDACWAFSYASDGGSARVQAVMDEGVLPKIVALLDHTSSAVRTPALRCIGNFIAGDDLQTDMVIAAGVLPKLITLVSPHQKVPVRKEAMWTVSNLAAGTREQLDSLISSGIISHVVDATKEAPFEVRKEAVWTISNGVTGGTVPQVEQFVRAGAIGGLLAVLQSQELRIATVALDALEVIFRSGTHLMGSTGTNPYVEAAEVANAVEILDVYQDAREVELMNRAQRILRDFFDAQEASDDETPAMGGAANPFAQGFTGFPSGPTPGFGGAPTGSTGFPSGAGGFGAPPTGGYGPPGGSFGGFSGGGGFA
jgi:importin subunit alpha-6/7